MNENSLQEEIKRALIKASDNFQFAARPQRCRDYVLLMLFLKYISGLANDGINSDSQPRDDNQNYLSGSERPRTSGMSHRTRSDRLVIPNGSSFYDLHDKRNEANIGELINDALEKIEQANSEQLGGVFRNFDFNSPANFGRTKDRNRLLMELLEHFAQPELDLAAHRVSQEIVAECFMHMISYLNFRFAAIDGRHSAPDEIADLLAKLAMAGPGSSICDPACGTGSLLLRVAKEADSGEVELFGQEAHGANWSYARMNMLLNSMNAAKIEWCDMLASPAFANGDRLMTFDVVVSSPPFAPGKWDAENADKDPYNRFWRGVPPASKAEFGYISHMLQIAKPKSGRVAVIFPHGVLFRGGAERKIRRAFIDENLLDAVIGLPGNLFAETSIPVVALVFDRSREKGGANEMRRDVLFVDASGCASQANQTARAGRKNQLHKDQVSTILATCAERSQVKGLSYLASFEDISKKDFNLNIRLYVDTSEPEIQVDVKTLKEQIERLGPLLDDTRVRMNDRLQELRAKA